MPLLSVTCKPPLKNLQWYDVTMKLETYIKQVVTFTIGHNIAKFRLSLTLGMRLIWLKLKKQHALILKNIGFN